MAAAAFYPSGGERRYHAAAWGRYSGSRILFAGSGWKKAVSATGASYWRSAPQELSVAMSSRRALISNGDPLIREPGVTMPGGFGDFVRGVPPGETGEAAPRDPVIAGWIGDAAGPLNRFLNSLGLPLQIPAKQVFFAVYRAGGEAGPGAYETRIRLETASSAQARGLVSLFAMAGALIGGASPESPLGGVAPFFANPPVQEEAALLLHTGAMDQGRIALLFNLVSAHSK
jgi:hypothetical protein